MPPNEQLIIIAEAKSKPGEEDALREALLGMVEPSRAEPGCVQYVLHEHPAAPGHFFFYEIWRDDAAFEAHTRMPHFVALGPVVAELKEDGPPLRLLRILA